MAGHSHAKNVMHQKGKEDAKKGRIFNKLAREITVAAKQGLPDPAHNPRLRAALSAARKSNLPRDRIDRAIKAAQPGEADGNYDEVRYEAYGPGGCALIIEALTDNRNRTAPELRTILSKLGGNLAESGAVAFMFSRAGELQYALASATADAMLEAVIEAGGENVETDNLQHVITTSVDDFGTVRDALEKRFGEPEKAHLTWYPQTRITVTGDDAQNLVQLLEALEDNDDVQTVFGNYEIPESEMAKLAS